MSSFTAHFGRRHVQKARNAPRLMSHSTVMLDQADCVFVAWLSDSAAGIQQTSTIN